MKYTLEMFKEKLAQKNPNLKVLSTEYINNDTHVTVQCQIDGYTWDVLPRKILTTGNCPVCVGHYLTQEQVQKRLEEIAPDLEFIGEYKNNHTKLKMRCKKCNGEFERNLQKIESSHGSCPLCGDKKVWTEEMFIKELKKIDETIIYVSRFKSVDHKITCKCSVCDTEWTPLAMNLLKYHGCPTCNKISRGESRIDKFLRENDIKFIREKSVKLEGTPRRVRFDFYLPETETYIEFDGQQHFKPVPHFGGEAAYQDLKKKDGLKNKYCQENGYELIRIRYDEFEQIEDILTEKLLKGLIQ